MNKHKGENEQYGLKWRRRTCLGLYFRTVHRTNHLKDRIVKGKSLEIILLILIELS